MEIADLIIDQNKIAVRWETEGVNLGDFFNFKATYKHFNLSGQTIYRFTHEGQIGEVWQSWDMLGLLRQLGYGKPIL